MLTLVSINRQYVWVIDQVWGQDGWMLAKFFFCVFMDLDFVLVHKLAKKERDQYPAILTEQNLVNKGFIVWVLVKFCLRDRAGSPERARWLHLDPSGSQSQRAIWFILPARGASHIIIRKYWTDWKTFWLAELNYWPSHLSQWRNNYTHRWHIRVLEVSKCEKELCFLRLLADARFLDSLYSRCRSRFFKPNPALLTRNKSLPSI